MKESERLIYKTALLLIYFLIMFFLNYASVIGWTFAIFIRFEDKFQVVTPNVFFNLFHLLVAISISGMAILIYTKLKNKTVFFIFYTSLTLIFLILTGYIFRGFMI